VINTTTYSDFYAYVQKNKRNCKLYWYIQMEPIDAGTNEYFTDCPDNNIANYVIADLTLSAFTMRADLYNGSYTNGPVHITLENWAKPQADGTTERFSDDQFSSTDFETGVCTISIGEEGASSITPIYAGRMANFRHTYTRIEFDVVDRSIFELGDIPADKFTRANYADIDEELIDKPIPLVYGQWDTSGTYKYRDEVFVPAYIIENKIDQSTPQIKFEIADHTISDIGDLVIYDDARKAPGYIQDTVSEDAANAQCTLTLNSSDEIAMLEAYFYLYPNRVDRDPGGNNAANTIDGDFSTSATVAADDEWLLFYFPNVEPYGREQLEPDYSDSNGEKTKELQAYIQISMYDSSALEAGDEVDIKIKNSTFVQTLDQTAINDLSSSNSFNWTSDALQLTYPYEWDGSTHSIAIEEADDDSGTSNTGNKNITPDAGVYWTMSDFASELEKTINDTSGLSNTYTVSYLANLNKFKIQVESGSKYFKVKNLTRSDDIGFTADSTSWKNDDQISDDYTILDVPDGDFSLLLPYIVSNMAALSEGELTVKELRVKIIRKYRAYNLKTITSLEQIKTAYSQGRTPEGYERFRIVERWTSVKRQVATPDTQKLRSVRDEISGSSFFVTCTGREFGSWIDNAGRSNSYDEGDAIVTAPYIVEDLLRNEASITGINELSFDHAHSNLFDGTWNVGHNAYFDSLRDLRQIIFDLMKYSRGFIFIDHTGDYKAVALEYGYESGDVVFTIYGRDIKEPLNDNFVVTRNEIGNVSNDLTLFYAFDPMRGDYQDNTSKTNTTEYTLLDQEMSCPYVSLNSSTLPYADRLAEYFCGDGATYGQFGELKKVVEMTTVNPEFHFAELGDIMKFDSTDFTIKAFGSTISDIYFMLIEKQFDKHQIKMKLLEVG